MSTMLRNLLVIGIVIVVHVVLIYWLAFGMKQVSSPPQLMTVTLHTSLLPSRESTQEVSAPAAVSVDESAPKPLVEESVKEVKPQRQEPKPEPKQEQKPTPPKTTTAQPISQKRPKIESSTPTTKASTQAGQAEQADHTVGIASSNATSAQMSTQSDAASGAKTAGGGAVTAPSHDAAYLKNTQPSYPDLSRRLGEEGKVVLRTLVSSKGTALNVEIKSSSGHKRLDQAALNAVKRWRFIPAQERGVAVDMWHDVPIHFSLRDS